MKSKFKDKPEEIKVIKIENLDKKINSEIVFGPEFATSSFLND